MMKLRKLTPDRIHPARSNSSSQGPSFPPSISWSCSQLACIIFAELLLMMALLDSASAEPLPNDAAPTKDAEKENAGLVLFRDHVSALLTHHCLACHGGEATKGELDLTTHERLVQGGLHGPAIVQGKSSESRLLKRIKHVEDPHMPFKQPKLPDEDIARIAAWIDAGAPYEKPIGAAPAGGKAKGTVSDEDRRFWSFQPLQRVEPPAIEHESWCRTPIDRFVLAKLEEKGLLPNPPVDRRRLIRRAYFDVIGLPPTPEEIDAFVNDPSNDAYERVIDDLLASPHYGERWGRHWLDLARFAESHGYEHDTDRPSAYHYRDFVIKALNQDLPFDRFVAWQIAGDELEPDNPLAMMATGFLGAGTHATQITANQVEKERYDELDDMAATIGTSLLGMTIGCARCHDHKFDPIPQRDYYRFLSTFTTTVRNEIELDLNPEVYRNAKARFDREHSPLTEALERFEKEQLPGRLEAWLRTNPVPPRPRWMTLDLETLKSEGGATLTKQEDLSILVGGKKVKNDTYVFTARTSISGVAAVKLEALAHPSLPKTGPGRATNSNFALSDFRVSVTAANGSSSAVPVKLVGSRATFEQKGLPVAAAIDDDPKSAWAIDPEFGKNQAAVFDFESPVGSEVGSILTFTLKFDTNVEHAIGCVRLSISTEAVPVTIEGERLAHDQVLGVTKALKVRPDRRTADQLLDLSRWYRTLDVDWRKLDDRVREHQQQMPRPALTKVMVTSEGLPAIRLDTQGADFFDKTYFLGRGDPNRKQGEATLGFLQVLMRSTDQEQHWQVSPPAGARTSYRRRSLANWITDSEKGAGHLLARVIVNRVWQHLLGRGIVGTPSDFGVQGERPTHPELLDWLAQRLIDCGWSLKRIQKSILMSAVYAQGTEFDEGRAAIDPRNTWLWRHVRRRLEGEVIRDAMLAASGTLDATMYGPGTLDEGQRRRSIYFTTKRSRLIPMLMLFDAPDSLQSMGNRSSTTVAPQALALMNSPHVRRYAEGFSRRLLNAQKDPARSQSELVTQAYLIALGRQPAEAELQDAVAFCEQQAAAHRGDGKQNANELALTEFCQALLCLNEFIFIE